MSAFLSSQRNVQSAEDFTVRSFRAGDEAHVVNLWNASYASYAGLATRTVEYWRWSILDRPGMSEDDILLIESGAQLLGYAAVWSGGKVLELVVDSSLSDTRRRRLTQRLLSGLEARARARNWDSIDLLLPVCDRVIDRALRSAGYAVEEGPELIVRLLNPAALLRTLTAARTARLAPLRDWTLLITLTAGEDPFLLQHRLCVQFGDAIDVAILGEGEPEAADAELQLTLATLAELVFCGARASLLLATGGLRVDPPAAAPRVLSFLTALALDAPWYTPHSDAL